MSQPATRRGPGQSTSDSAAEGRSARKRRAIVEAATTLFLHKGYQGTSMDEVATVAAVSKQTVYKNFADKERLFTEIVTGTADRVGGVFRTEIRALRNTDDLAPDLGLLARRYLASVMQPRVLRLRRLVIGEAIRLPDLAHAYYRRAPEQTVAAFADCFGRLAERGLLRVDDPTLAAHHFAFLVLGRPLDRALFCREEDAYTATELDEIADAGVRVFLAAYAPN